MILTCEQPACLDIFTAAVKDGRGRELHRRLFVIESTADGAMFVRQPTLFLDLIPAPKGVIAPDGQWLPPRSEIEQTLVTQTQRLLRRSTGRAAEGD